MTQEHRYFATITLLSISGLIGLGNLLQKYGAVIFGHWVDTCRLVVTNFFSSGTHYAGLVVVVLVVLAAGAGIIRVVFSLIKTNQKVNRLLRFQIFHTPGKLRFAIASHQLTNRQLVVIDHPDHYAFSFGLIISRILISSGLIDLLPAKQLESVILHELYHLRHRHGVLLFISDILAATVFFFPIIKTLINKMRGLCERQADAFVIHTQADSSHLKLALAKVMPGVSCGYPQYPEFAVVDVRDRLNQLLNRPPLPTKTPFLPVFISILVFLLGIGLWLLPTQSHALAGNRLAVDCNTSQCSTHCLEPVSN